MQAPGKPADLISVGLLAADALLFRFEEMALLPCQNRGRINLPNAVAPERIHNSFNR